MKICPAQRLFDIIRFSCLTTSVYVLIKLLLFSLQLAVPIDRIKTARFPLCFVHEYNFYTFGFTKMHVKNRNKQREDPHYLPFHVRQP